MSIRNWSTVVVCLAVFTIGAVPAKCDEAPHGLTSGGGKTVLRNGKPYRGVGVNYFDCFLRTLHNPDDRSYEDGFRVLAEYEIPFARFCATGFWPNGMQLYQQDREAYLSRLDRVVRAAERHGVGLIPSLFWYYACVPDLVDEPTDQWGNPKSKTHAFMRQYVHDVVTRYKDSDAIWAWEFGNEFNLACDLPNAATHRPKVVPHLGTRSERGPRDELTYDMLAIAVRAFGNEIRKYDTHRLITNGDSMPRPSAWHNRVERSWAPDNRQQFAEILEFTAPDPISLISVHCYKENIARLTVVAELAGELGKPLFLGEFQIPDIDDPGARTQFESLLKILSDNHVALAALWVYDFDKHEAGYNVSAKNGRQWQLQMLQSWNRQASRAHGEK